MEIFTVRFVQLIFLLLQVDKKIFALDYSYMINTNFDEHRNWHNRKRPCWRDTIKFEKSIPIATFLQEDHFGFTEIILPEEGEIIFGEDTIFLPGDAIWKTQPDCKERHTKIFDAGKKPSNYHNPANWYCATEKLATQPLLHVEMIPAQHDTAIFTEVETYKINVDVAIMIGQLNISGFSHNTDTFESYINDFEGAIQFSVPESEDVYLLEETVQITRGKCTEIRGCINNNMQDKYIFKNICNNVLCNNEEVPCSRSFVPAGHCCRFCGGRILFETESASYETLKQNLLHILWKVNNGQESSKQIGLSLLLTSANSVKNQYQITFGPRNQTFKYNPRLSNLYYDEVVRKLADFSVSDMLGNFNIVQSDQSTTLVVVDAAAVIFTLLILLFLILTATYVVIAKRQGNWRWFMTVEGQSRMAWWRHGEDEVQLELPETSEDASEEENTPPLPAKPVLKQVKSQPVSQPAEERVPSDKLLKHFENPSYKGLMGSGDLLFEDKDPYGSLRSSVTQMETKNQLGSVKMMVKSTKSVPVGATFSNPSYDDTDITDEDL